MNSADYTTDDNSALNLANSKIYHLKKLLPKKIWTRVRPILCFRPTPFEPQIYSDTFSHYTIFYNLDSSNIFHAHPSIHPWTYPINTKIYHPQKLLPKKIWTRVRPILCFRPTLFKSQFTLQLLRIMIFFTT